MDESQDIYATTATLVLIAHGLWIAWIVLGGALAYHFRKLRPWHLVCVLLTLAIFALRELCPLTDLETWLHLRAGEPGYTEGFIVYHLNRLVYSQDQFIPSAVVDLGLITLAAAAICFGYRDKLNFTSSRSWKENSRLD